MASYAYESGNLGSGSPSGEAWSVRVDRDGQRYLVVETPRHGNLRGIENGNGGADTKSRADAKDVQWCQAQIRKLSNVIGNGMVRSELNDLNMYFSEWKAARSSSAREKEARSIRSRFVQEKTLFCSDMSGFSRICKAEGILHFLALLKTMQSIMLPILESHGGELIKVAADNLFVVFDSPTQAMEATWKCFAAAAKYSEGKKKNDSILISAGLATGPMWIVKGADVFGNTANLAFELGENMASKELLVDSSVADACAGDPRFSFEMREGEIIGEKRRYAKVSLTDTLQNLFPQNPPNFVPPVVNPPINSEEPNDFVSMIQARQLAQMQGPAAVQAADTAMNARFTKRKAVLVIEMYEQAEVAAEYGVLPFIDMVLTMKNKCRMAVKHRNGKCVRSIETKIIGQIMALFDSPTDCMKAAIEARYRCREEDFELAIGVGFTEILDLDSCNCFGDAVNMAFKLGEDTAKGNEILITENVRNSVVAAGDFPFKMEDMRSVELSGITIKHWNVEYDEWKAEELVESLAAHTAAHTSSSSPSKGKRMDA
jgi:class 3 adenylate cyclase